MNKTYSGRIVSVLDVQHVSDQTSRVIKLLTFDWDTVTRMSIDNSFISDGSSSGVFVDDLTN